MGSLTVECPLCRVANVSNLKPLCSVCPMGDQSGIEHDLGHNHATFVTLYERIKGC